MNHEQIRSMCEVAKNIALDVNDEELRPYAFGAILSALLNERSVPAGGTQEDSSGSQSHKNAAPAALRKGARKAGLKSRLISLVEANFFQSPRSVSEVASELEVAGWMHKTKEISSRLIELAREQHLRRSKSASGLLYSKW